MFKLNKLSLVLLLGAATSMNVYANDIDEAKENVKEVRDVEFYNNVEVHVSGDKNADKIFKKYFSQYSKYNKSINKEMTDHVKDITQKITKSIDQTSKYLLEDQATFDANCKTELTENEIAQCEKMEKSIYEMKEGISGMEVELKNRVASIENARMNRLGKNHMDYKNRVGKLIVDVKNNQAQK